MCRMRQQSKGMLPFSLAHIDQVKFLEVSGDRLVIAIEARDAKYDAVATRQFLEEIGGTDIEEVSA